jgi:putative DNA primase/helicase
MSEYHNHESAGDRNPAIPRLPDGLTQRAQWVLWRYEERNGKRTKIPYQVSGKRAKSDDARTWGTFDAVSRGLVAEGLGHFEGIGFVFADGDPFVGIDIDSCIGEDGAVKPWAQPLIQKFSRTYQEIPPQAAE